MHATPDQKRSTVGGFVSAAGTVGMARGQTARLSIVNLGANPVRACGALTANPRPIQLARHEWTLEAGEGREMDLRHQDVPRRRFDKSGRLQLRAFVTASAATVFSNLELFDDQTGRTSLVLPLQALAGLV